MLDIALTSESARLGAVLDQLRAATYDGRPEVVLGDMPRDDVLAVSAALRLRSMILRLMVAELRVRSNRAAVMVESLRGVASVLLVIGPDRAVSS